ncbi:MAG TPA: diadenylate cyclase [bacterium]|nr:diadenylate cyclase [bacterium]
MKRTHQTLLQSAFRIAKSTKAKAVLLFLDPLGELPDLEVPKGCALLFVTRKSKDELEGLFPDGLPASSPVVMLPKIDMTRIGLVKMAVALAISNRLIELGDKIVFVAGHPELNSLDAIFSLDTATESEILTTQGVAGISESVNPEVFQTALAIALELASRGREGKPIGTIFVIGDEEKVLQLSKQMIINPFKGYSDDERNLLNPGLKETLREFSALDGAFVIGRDGLVLTAGRYLGAASDEATIPRGLGSRHIAASGITAMTQAIAIVISESTGDVRIFKNGKIIMEIEKPIRVPQAS